jgi:cytochrome c5
VVAGIGLMSVGCGQAPDGKIAQPQSAANAEMADVSGAAAGPAPHPGEAIYQNYCFSCHTPGLSGSPKTGDKEAWAPRIAKGPDLLLASTIEGIPPAMPPRGMCFDCSDEDLAAAISYMVEKSQ